MRKLLPILLAVVGLIGGGGAGYLLRPPAAVNTAADKCGNPGTETTGHERVLPDDGAETDTEAVPAHEYVKLNNQFVVPIVENGEVAALVILSITLEVAAGATEQIYAREPKLRDVFLQVLFDHANSGGFGGAFTESNNMDMLRNALLEVARKSLGAAVVDVLIVDIVRQDG
jgi:hypothetical protein